ncbi:hypothetical protein AB0J82_11525 [Asanoa sp. NPDC049518]|uniref:hypothetical protein n=1 Tax=unclassified Asanoa TaxID=2685164 RepID=UPI0034464F9F
MSGPGRTTETSELAQSLLELPATGAEAERDAALRTLDAADARWWLGFDESLRSHWSWAFHGSWPVVARVARGGFDALDVVLAGCHADGRIREAVLARLATLGSPAATTLLAIRTGDWVPQVRDRARREVDALLPTAGERSLLALATTATATRRRFNGGWLAARIDGHVTGLTAERLEPLLRLGDSRLRRIAYRTAIDRHLIDADHLARAATKDHDQAIRIMAARAAVAGARSLATLHRLAASRTAVVRAEALTALAAGGDTAAAIGALPDRHPVVRDVAQDAVRATGGDPAEHYRRLLTGSVPPPGAVAGLGETGGPADAPALRASLAHPRARGRVAALRALRRLGGLTTDDAVALLTDPSSAVVKNAVAALVPAAATLDAGLPERLLAPGQARHVRLAGYRLAVARGPWQRLIADLRLLDDPDEQLNHVARVDIHGWLSRAATVYRTPTSAQRTELAALLDRAVPTLGSAGVLRFHAGLT